MPVWWADGSTPPRAVTSLGCYQDVWPNPKFGFMSMGWHDVMTPQLCADTCAQAHIGIEMGSRCFCGGRCVRSLVGPEASFENPF